MSLFKGERVTLTKLDAARRELKTAIELWFSDGDLVSIHALAFASYEVIHFVSKHRNRQRELILDSLIVKDEYRKEWRALISKEANFLKHADRDPDGSVELSPGMPIFFMMFAIMGLGSMGEKLTQIEKAFYTWLCFNHPEMLTDQGRKQYKDPFEIDQLDAIRSLSKSEFLEAFTGARHASTSRPRGVTIGHIQLPKF